MVTLAQEFISLVPIVIVDCDSELDEVALRGQFYIIGDTTIRSEIELILLECLVTLLNTTGILSLNLVFKAASRIFGESCGEKVFRLDSRDESSVPWKALVLQLMGRAVNP